MLAAQREGAVQRSWLKYREGCLRQLCLALRGAGQGERRRREATRTRCTQATKALKKTMPPPRPSTTYTTAALLPHLPSPGLEAGLAFGANVANPAPPAPKGSPKAGRAGQRVASPMSPPPPEGKAYLSLKTAPAGEGLRLRIYIRKYRHVYIPFVGGRKKCAPGRRVYGLAQRKVGAGTNQQIAPFFSRGGSERLRGGRGVVGGADRTISGLCSA